MCCRPAREHYIMFIILAGGWLCNGGLWRLLCHRRPAVCGLAEARCGLRAMPAAQTFLSCACSWTCVRGRAQFSPQQQLSYGFRLFTEHCTVLYPDVTSCSALIPAPHHHRQVPAHHISTECAASGAKISVPLRVPRSAQPVACGARACGA